MSQGHVKTKVLGYPRIGHARELKKVTESYWKGDLPIADLKQAGAQIRKANWLKQQEAGIDVIPSNDFSYYDQMLDMTCLLGNIPERFHWDGQTIDLDMVFFLARGLRPDALQAPVAACEMTKWFDTNYHYIVPELSVSSQFKLATTKVFDEFKEAKELGITTVPVLIGPVTYLMLGKNHGAEAAFDPLALLPRLLPVYENILKQLSALGATWVQIDEPVVVLDLKPHQRQALKDTYTCLSKAANIKIMTASYFGPLRENLDTFASLTVAGLHIDAVRATEEVTSVAKAIGKDKVLSVGVVDGRNIWKNDYTASLEVLNQARAILGDERLVVASSCSLIHVPLSLSHEKNLDAELKEWMAFAEEKLGEINTLADLLKGQQGQEAWAANQAVVARRAKNKRIHNDQVVRRLNAVRPTDLERHLPFAKRRPLQRAKLNLPLFPTTTIGSFPQTTEVRAMRAKHKIGGMSDDAYDVFIKDQIRQAVDFQHEIGIDMLVHGEFERNDMVEYFGEQLEGFVFTLNGWVQSYGSRYVKPPIIFGDVSRLKPMTVRWSAYAQSLTQKPMKGMLTGPVTIAQWSFVRNDQPREQTVKQIALAIRDEVLDLEKAGIAAIQIDEPALREGLPLRRGDWDTYLKWTVEAFRISSAGVNDATQIHTHMCYSEFNDIIEAIAALDADVISIETSRSQMELLDAFEHFNYPNEIGPGVYDIHSPQIPAMAQMLDLLLRATRVLPAEHIWVNPDCGLKTRQWVEVKQALKNMVLAANTLRLRVTLS